MIAGRLWSPRTVAEQPLLVVWEVLGHLDLLLAAGTVTERGGGRRHATAHRALAHFDAGLRRRRVCPSRAT